MKKERPRALQHHFQITMVILYSNTHTQIEGVTIIIMIKSLLVGEIWGEAYNNRESDLQNIVNALN